MTYAPNDPDVNQMMAVFDKLSRQADTAKDEMAMAVNSFVGRAQDIIATKIAENAELRAQLAERNAVIAQVTNILGGYSDSDLLSLVRTVAIGYQQWSDGHDTMTDSLRAQVAKRDELIAQVTKILGGYPDSDLLSLATTVAAGYERWSDGYDAQVEALRTQIATLWEQLAERDATILTLTERLNRCACTDDYGDVKE